MFIYDDLMARKATGAIVDFAEEATRRGLIDTDQAPKAELFILPVELASIDAWPAHVRDSMLAEMIGFVVGNPVTWGDAEEGNCLKPLYQKAGWVEFKNRMSPHSRLFGAFPQRDLLITVRARLKRHVTKDNEAQINGAWENFWGVGSHVPRLPANDPDLLLSNYRTNV